MTRCENCPEVVRIYVIGADRQSMYVAGAATAEALHRARSHDEQKNRFGEQW